MTATSRRCLCIPLRFERPSLAKARKRGGRFHPARPSSPVTYQITDLPPRGPVSRDLLSDTARNAAGHLPAHLAEPFAQFVGVPAAHALRQRITGRADVGAVVAECKRLGARPRQRQTTLMSPARPDTTPAIKPIEVSSELLPEIAEILGVGRSTAYRSLRSLRSPDQQGIHIGPTRRNGSYPDVRDVVDARRNVPKCNRRIVEASLHSATYARRNRHPTPDHRRRMLDLIRLVSRSPLSKALLIGGRP